jgi:hypothetical protein
MLVGLALALLGCSESAVWAQALATTTVQDTVYSANGTPASGSVVVSWNAFTTASGMAVQAGSTAVTIGTGGALSVPLAPNAGATPMGSYYTAVYHLNDGTTSKEFWVVPVTVAGGGPVKVASIRNQVLPTSVAMQTVSKQYVDNAIAQAEITPIPLDNSPYVEKSGDTMTGPLVLPGDPATANQAADKNYVDENIAQVTAGLGGKVSLLPSTTQVVNQPSGTELEVNRLNGELHTPEFGSYAVDSLATALSQPDCGVGCRVVVDANDTFTSTVPGIPPQQEQHVEDQRAGGDVEVSRDPLLPDNTMSGKRVDNYSTRSVVTYAGTKPGSTVSSAALVVNEQALSGGSNQDPTNIETPPYYKATYGALVANGNYYTAGQHVQMANLVNCYAVGDCLAGSQIIQSSGGPHDPSDEGTHPYDLQTTEDTRVFTGTCSSGCTTGSTSVVVTGGNGTQGEGRFLIDKNPADVITAGTLIGGADSANAFATAQFSGTNFPVSVFLQTATAITSQPANAAPGTVTVAILTSGVVSGVATNTAALPGNSGIACVADHDTLGQRYPNFETAPYTVVDGTHIQLTLNKPHATNAFISVGGLCGYGLEQTADTAGAIREVFPVVGSINATSLYYADSGAPLIGRTDLATTSAFVNMSLPIAAITRQSNTVTVTTAQAISRDLEGVTLTVSGVADPSYNGSYTVHTTSLYTLTYSDAGADSTSTGGTVSILTGGYALYPMAEVLSVYDAATRAVDGTITLAPNTVPWATGDAVEEPHYHVMSVYPDFETVVQYMPRPYSAYIRPGERFAGGAGPGLSGWDINNFQPASWYYGAGGTHQPPDQAYMVEGVWSRDIDAVAGTQAVMSIHCNLHGCNRWDSAYDLMEMDAAAGRDSINYAPQSNTLTINTGGVPYSFASTGLTAGTINVGTLNATHLSASLDASSIVSGVLSAARLPVFGPSGATHAPGAVPDPGATAGATRFLREDATWAVPPKGSSGTVVLSGGIGGTLTSTAPSYYAFGSPVLGSSLAMVAANLAHGGAISNVTMTLQNDPGSGVTVTATLWVNGASTALSCTVTGNGSTGTTCSDTTHSVTVNTGQQASWVLTTSTTATIAGSRWVSAFWSGN